MVLTGETEALGEKLFRCWWKMDGLVWSNCGIVLTGETEVQGKKYFRWGVRWMNDYGAIVEWY
jgi:hypothetical protein